jgi:hypothetical protein
VVQATSSKLSLWPTPALRSSPSLLIKQLRSGGERGRISGRSQRYLLSSDAFPKALNSSLQKSKTGRGGSGNIRYRTKLGPATLQLMASQDAPTRDYERELIMASAAARQRKVVRGFLEVNRYWTHSMHRAYPAAAARATTT